MIQALRNYRRYRRFVRAAAIDLDRFRHQHSNPPRP